MYNTYPSNILELTVVRLTATQETVSESRNFYGYDILYFTAASGSGFPTGTAAAVTVIPIEGDQPGANTIYVTESPATIATALETALNVTVSAWNTQVLDTPQTFYLNLASTGRLILDPVGGGSFIRVVHPSVTTPILTVTETPAAIRAQARAIINSVGIPDPLRLSDGTNTEPTYSFSDEVGTGMYRDTANDALILVVEEVPVFAAASDGAAIQVPVDYYPLYAATVATAGATQASATLLSTTYSQVTVNVATEGVLLPPSSSTPLLHRVIRNDTKIPLRVYPAVGDTITQVGTINLPFFIPPYGTAIFLATAPAGNDVEVFISGYSSRYTEFFAATASPGPELPAFTNAVTPVALADYVTCMDPASWLGQTVRVSNLGAVPLNVDAFAGTTIDGGASIVVAAGAYADLYMQDATTVLSLI